MIEIVHFQLDIYNKEVLRDIRKIIDTASGLSEEFRQRNFAPSSYINNQNKKQPCYCMTRDGFTILAMDYTGQKAMKFKELYCCGQAFL